MQLSSQNLALLLEEVAAMISANRPIAAGLFELGDRSLGRVGRIARRLAQRLEAGESPEAAFASVSGYASPEVAAAFRLLENVGSAAPIRCVARSIQHRNETRTQLAVAFIYPIITFFVAYLVVALVIPWFLLSTDGLPFGRPDLDERLLATFTWLRNNVWLPPVVVAVVGLVWYFLVSPRLGMSGWPGIGRARADQRWSLFCDMLALEVDAGVPTGQAIASAAEAAGGVKFRDMTVAASAQLGPALVTTSRSQTAGFLPPMLRWSLSRIISGSGSDLGFELRLLADWYRDQSLARNRFWIDWFPVLATVTVMTTVIAVVMLVMLVPLYSLLG